VQPRLDLITLGVPDLEQARRFYVDGLGWPPALDVPGEVVFIQVGHGLLLGLWEAANLADDVGVGPFAPGAAPVSLAQILPTEQDVLDTLERAQAAGGTILKPGRHAAFGGFHGYFADPAGFRWEVATNPGWHVDADGRVSIVPVENAGPA
jgi:catechol 2,3-dioxygenase-like lactoylglutathione lyase family enzyme